MNYNRIVTLKRWLSGRRFFIEEEGIYGNNVL